MWTEYAIEILKAIEAGEVNKYEPLAQSALYYLLERKKVPQGMKDRAAVLLDKVITFSPE